MHKVDGFSYVVSHDFSSIRILCFGLSDIHPRFFPVTIHPHSPRFNLKLKNNLFILIGYCNPKTDRKKSDLKGIFFGQRWPKLHSESAYFLRRTCAQEASQSWLQRWDPAPGMQPWHHESCAGLAQVLRHMDLKEAGDELVPEDISRTRLVQLLLFFCARLRGARL